MTISNRSTYLKANPQRFRQSTFCELFKETVSLYPDKIAVKEGKRQLTYRELEAKTNCLAHALAEAGIASGEIVGIAAGQSICSVVAMIGIWKASGSGGQVGPDRLDPVCLDGAERRGGDGAQKELVPAKGIR